MKFEVVPEAYLMWMLSDGGWISTDNSIIDLIVEIQFIAVDIIDYCSACEWKSQINTNSFREKMW